MVETVPKPFHASWATLDWNSTKTARGAHTELRKMVEIKLHVPRNHEIDKSVTIVVPEGGASGPTLISQMCLLSHIGKRAIAIVAIKHHPLFASDEDVRPAIIVVVANRASHCPTRVPNPRFVGHVGERPIMVVAVERTLCFLSVKCHVDSWRIGEINVKPTIAIVVDQQNSARH